MLMPWFLYVYGVLLPTLRGFTVSSSILTTGVLSLIATHLADHYVRLDIVMARLFVFAAGTALKASSSSLLMLLVGRALAGGSEGFHLGDLCVLSLLPYYSAMSLC